MRRLPLPPLMRAAVVGLRFRFDKKPMQPWTDGDDVTYRGDGEMVDPNLVVHSTNLGSVVEMPSEDVNLLIQTMSSNYSKSIYALALFDSIDIVRLMVQHRLMASSERAALRRWFFNPSDFLRNPVLVPEALGLERWSVLSTELDRAMDVFDTEGSSIAIALKQQNLPAGHWNPILRWIASEGLEGDFKSQLPSFALALAEARGPTGLGINSLDKAKRAPMVGRLFVAAGKEFGRVQLATLGTDLIRSAGDKLTFKDQKSLTISVSRSSRRALDWQMRQSGALPGVADKWDLLRGLSLSAPLSSVSTRFDLPQQEPITEEEAQSDPTEDEDAAVVTDAALGVRPDSDVVDVDHDALEERTPRSSDPFASEEDAPDPDDFSMSQPELPKDLLQRTSALVESHFDRDDAAKDDDAEPGAAEETIAAFFKAEKRRSDVTAVLLPTLEQLPVGELPKKKSKKEVAEERSQLRFAMLQGILSKIETKDTEKTKKRRQASGWVKAITGEGAATTTAVSDDDAAVAKDDVTPKKKTRGKGKKGKR